MQKRPNILVILSDQQRWDTVECYGQPIHRGLTPNLDRLASEGVRFNHAFTCQPVCGPVRSTLQTGLYPTQTGCYINNIALPLDSVTIAKLLSGAGYETGYIGKWHLASDSKNIHATKAIPPERRGGYKDHWLAADVLEYTSSGYEGFMFDAQNNRVDFEGYRVDCTANFVVDYLRNYATRRSDCPFFLFTSIIEPHHQNDLDRYIGPIGSKQRFANYRTPPDLVGTQGDWRLHLPDYLGCCWSIDQNVGRIREQLNLLGLAENTIVIYTSDHGCHFRTRNAEYKRSCHEDSIRVPMIMHGPAHTGFTGGRVVDELVSLIDLPETILAAAGVAIPQEMRGRPMQQLLGDKPRMDWPGEVYVQISESQTGRAVRTMRWKYGVDGVDSEGKPQRGKLSERYVEQYLYDLSNDPAERENLVGVQSLSPVRTELAARLLRRLADAGEPAATIMPAPREDAKSASVQPQR